MRKTAYINQPVALITTLDAVVLEHFGKMWTMNRIDWIKDYNKDILQYGENPGCFDFAPNERTERAGVFYMRDGFTPAMAAYLEFRIYQLDRLELKHS